MHGKMLSEFDMSHPSRALIAVYGELAIIEWRLKMTAETLVETAGSRHAQATIRNLMQQFAVAILDCAKRPKAEGDRIVDRLLAAAEEQIEEARFVIHKNPGQAQ